MGRTTWLLIAARAVRSIGQGAMVVDFALYLKALGWSAVAISVVLGAALLVGAALTLLVGPLSDRIGRRRFLLGFEAAQMLASLAGLVSAAPSVVVAAGLVGGFGRGGNGAAGPFAPVEQAWLAQSVRRLDRGRIYSLNSAGGFIGMGVGALLAALPARFAAILPGPLAFRPLFALTFACAAGCFLLCLRAADAEARPAALAEAALPGAAEAERAIRQAENGRVRRLILANVLNGTGVGLIGPLIAYWFSVRFGVGPARIAPVMAAAFALSAAASVGTGWIGQRIGVVRAVVAMRAIGLALLVALPFAPNFGVAAVLYALRGVFNRSTAGARAAVSVSLVRGRRRGLAVSAGNVAMQVPRGIAPVLAGALFEDGMLALPFLLGAAFQAAYLVVYAVSFRAHDPSLTPAANAARNLASLARQRELQREGD